MRKMSLALAALAAVGKTGFIGRATDFFDRVPLRAARGRPPVRGRHYPEQGPRQKLRALRRAQGGPGIEFTPNGWQPRPAINQQEN